MDVIQTIPFPKHTESEKLWDVVRDAPTFMCLRFSSKPAANSHLVILLP